MLDEAAEWSEKTFPQSSFGSVLAHLLREWRELEDSGFTDPSEFADVILLLNHLAFKQGFSLDDAVEEKFEVNKKRVWGKPDAEGVSEHIRQEWEGPGNVMHINFLKLDKDGNPYGIGSTDG